MAASSDPPFPRFVVLYRGILRQGLALAAYADGLVLVEDESGMGPSTRAPPGRWHRFRDFLQAREELLLPMQLAAGELRLQADPSACSPRFLVIRVDKGLDSLGASAVSRVSFGFEPEQDCIGSAEFRAFQKRMASPKALPAASSKQAPSLATRLELTQEAFDYVSRTEGMGGLEERLAILGVADTAGADEAWRLEVQRATAQLRERIGQGPVTAQALKEVLTASPGQSAEANQLDGHVTLDDGSELLASVWESFARGPPNLEPLMAWLLAKRPSATTAASEAGDLPTFRDNTESC